MEHCRQRGDRRVRGRPRPAPGSGGGGRGEAGAARPCRACGDLRGASPARLSLAQRLAVPLDAGRAVPGDGPCILGLWFPGRLAEKSLAEGRLASPSGPAPRAGASRSPLPRFSFDHLSDDGAGPDAFLTWLSCAPRETSLSEKPLAPAAFPGAADSHTGPPGSRHSLPAPSLFDSDCHPCNKYLPSICFGARTTLRL